MKFIVSCQHLCYILATLYFSLISHTPLTNCTPDLRPIKMSCTGDAETGSI